MSKMITLKPQHLLKIIPNILWSAFIFSLLSCVMASAKVEPLDRIIAIINNDVIMQSELNNRLKHVKQDMLHKGLKPPAQDILKKQILEFMIIENLQLQQAKKQNIKISDQELNEATENLAKKNNMSLSQFKESLKSENLPFNEVQEQLSHEMMIARVQEQDVVKSIHISEQEIKNYLASPEGKRHQQYHLAHILITVPENASAAEIKKTAQKANSIYDEVIKDPSNFSNIAIKESEGQFALQGGDLGWRSTGELPNLFISTAEDLKPSQISKPLRNSGGFHILKLLGVKNRSSSFEEQYHVRHILTGITAVRSDANAHDLADKIYRKLKARGNFTKLAKSFSDDHTSSLKGGDLGWVTLNLLEPAFAKQVKDLTVGIISHPVKTSDGWHIIEVLGKRKEDVSETLQHEQVSEVLMKRKFEAELPVWIRSLKNSAYIERKLEAK